MRSRLQRHRRHLTAAIVLLGTAGTLIGTTGVPLGASAACGCEAPPEVWRMALMKGGREITEMANGEMAELEITSPGGGGNAFAIAATPNPRGSFRVEADELERCFGVYGANKACLFKPKVTDEAVGPSKLTFVLKAKEPDGLGALMITGS
jgi:hypothetical protein